jgi:iron complex outermembrane recepter protein
MNQICFVILLVTTSFFASAQNSANDSVPPTQLAELIVKSYEQNRKLSEIPAAINYITPEQLNRFNNINILSAINSTPGVRMEERSPGSYRINFRGSSLRSPFGVRNVKIYFDEIPFTDPTGNTYLNQLSFFNFSSIEIIKGIAGSLYGSGTGGAMLILSQPKNWSQGVELQYLQGSFSLKSYNAQIRFGQDGRRNTFNYSRQSSIGYRDHTNMRRNVGTWQTVIKGSDKQQLSALFLYGDLYYQTPGALTKAEYNVNAKTARPQTGALPSADAAHAAIYQKTFLSGLTNEYSFTSHFQNTSVLYGAFSQIKNPTFRNYEIRMEPHFGGRTVFKWNPLIENASFQLLFGSEAQRGFFNTKTFQNANGNPGILFTDDDINNWTYSVFTQGTLVLPNNWNATAGVSLNKSSVSILRLSAPASQPINKTYNSEWAPRFAISKKVVTNLYAYLSIANGFSPPTVQELLPSTSIINLDLQAEHGINYEGGLKGSWNKIYIEVNIFDFFLKNSIVQRRDSSGADYFVNAGSTKQQGIESQIQYQLVNNGNRFLNSAKVWVNHTYNNFRYVNFKQLNTDYSHHQLPSVGPHTITAGLDVVNNFGLYTNLNYFYSDPIELNDAATDHASSYHLLGGRIGWKTKVNKKLSFDLFMGVDNLFNEKYSMGNDINATGGRYYNVAPGINYYSGILLKY